MGMVGQSAKNKHGRITLSSKCKNGSEVGRYLLTSECKDGDTVGRYLHQIAKTGALSAHTLIKVQRWGHSRTIHQRATMGAQSDNTSECKDGGTIGQNIRGQRWGTVG